jgi:hypothetical protein
VENNLINDHVTTKQTDFPQHSRRRR